MGWYKNGTIAVSGVTVTGTGTNWTDNKQGIGPGQALLIPAAGTVKMYEILRVDSATKLTLTSSAGTVAAGQAYAIMSFYTDSIPDFARRLSAQLSYYQSQMDGWQQIMTGTGSITITAPDGTNVTISSFKKLTDDVAAKLDKNQNLNDLPNKATARTNLGLGSSATKDIGDSGGSVVSANNIHAAFMKATPMLVSNQASDFGGNFNLLPIGDSAIGLNASNGMASGPGITGQHWAILSQYGWGHKFLIDWIYSGSAVHLGTRFYNASGEVTGWTIFYNNRNTTKTSDGTLKAASPIVQVFCDGSFQLNDESTGCTVTRINTGEYLIEGCTGLNADAAWGGIDGGFDIPTDRNKQPLIWLDYEVNADGSILVRTYHRTHPAAPEFARNERDGIEEGEPVDIPADQFVSVRVEMPADNV